MVSAARRGRSILSKTVILAGVLGSANSVGAVPSEAERWTLEDIANVPDVTDIKLSAEKSYAFYIVRYADIALDENRSELRRVDLADGKQTIMLNASNIKRLQKIPGTKDWSALVDLGAGQQLYRISQDGETSAIIVNEQTVLVGSADQAIYSFDGEKPLGVGISSYDWSPDGKWLWYSKLRKDGEKEPVAFDEAVTRQRDQIRPPVRAMVEFYVRDAGGKDWFVASRPTKDFFAFRYGGRVKWDAGSVKYRTASPDGKDRYSFQTYAYSLTGHAVKPDTEQTANDSTIAVWGLNGGRLSSEGVGSKRRLVETLDSGKRFDFGEVDFSVGDPRAAAPFLSRDGKRAIVGIKNLNTHDYGLAIATQTSIHRIPAKGSFTKCDFDSDLTYGLCIRQGLISPPEIVSLQPQSKTVTRIAPVSGRHDKLLQLNASPRKWTNRLGYEATGYVILPSDYDKSKSYPTIFVTHGSDADERFASAELQWNYPVQYLVQDGYVVILINDPHPLQEPRFAAAMEQLISGAGNIPPSEIQKLVWLNNVYSIEDAAREMAKQGLVDLDRVGIAGYSRGSQIVNVAVTQSKMFKAGSSGDGSHLEPLTYTISKTTFDMIFGGPPFGENFKNYQALSPSLRAARSCGAILSQMAATYPGAIDFHSALRAAGVPAQISHYPGETPESDETHLFHIPSNRIAAMKENLAWFDFWLRGRNSDFVDPNRIKYWQNMAGQWRSNCPVTESDGP